MLDYAANGVPFWPPSALRERFEQTCATANLEAAALLDQLLGPDSDVEEFWTLAGRNLQTGKLRLVFVSDTMPDELRSVIECLNAHFRDIDVLGVEVRRYADGSGRECYVPRVVGGSAVSEVAKGRRPSVPLEDQLQAAGGQVVMVRDLLVAWAQEQSLTVVSAPASMQIHDARGTIVRLYPTYRSLEFALGSLWAAGRDDAVDEVINALRPVVTKQLTTKSPNIPVEVAAANWQAVVDVLNRLTTLRTEI